MSCLGFCAKREHDHEMELCLEAEIKLELILARCIRKFFRTNRGAAQNVE
jgi:hypothetical protein